MQNDFAEIDRFLRTLTLGFNLFFLIVFIKRFEIVEHIYPHTVNKCLELMTMMKVLIAAYHYPPLGGGGVFRSLKFSRYLPEFGYKPYVLTVKNPLRSQKDPLLMKDIPREASIIRTFSFEHRIFRAPRHFLNISLKWFFVPDEHIGWLPTAVSEGVKLIKKNNINVIYATGPVWTTFLIGFLLKKKTKKPLIIDFRDPWINNSNLKYPTKLHEFIEKSLEKKIVTQANYIIAATDLIRDDLIKRYPFVASKIETITNGFDPEDFKNLNLNTKSSKFRITYAGSIYGLLTARSFLSALKELIIENEEFKKNIEVVFVGNYGKETLSLVKEMRLADYVKLKEYIPHKKCLELVMNSDVLLLLITILGSKGKEILTGKIFEYLASQNPILAIAPVDGLASKLIRSLDAGIIVAPGDVRCVKESILLFYNRWRSGKSLLVQNNYSKIQKFNRKILTHRLSKIFDKFKQ